MDMMHWLEMVYKAIGTCLGYWFSDEVKQHRAEREAAAKEAAKAPPFVDAKYEQG